MSKTLKLNRNKWHEIRHLIFRNIFILVNLVTFSVASLLIYFGDYKEGVSIGIIIFLNTIVSITRDIHTWYTLEKIQFLTSVKIVKINSDNSETEVLFDEIKVGDKIRVKLGDQVPNDSVVVISNGLEVNEGIFTGESNSIVKNQEEIAYAGSIITAGSGILKVKADFNESRMAVMTKGIKKYSSNSSLIQKSVTNIVKYSGFVLFGVIIYMVYIGLTSNQPTLIIVKNIGALASMLVPQGLIISTTIIFSYGAIYSHRRHVLLQDVNASEKLGRIKNLCLDKTGTLTESELNVEGVFVTKNIILKNALDLSSAYVHFSGDISETIDAIKKYINTKFEVEILETLPFSSSRRFGAVLLGGEYSKKFILAGAPELFLKNLSSYEAEWLENLLKVNATMGKRLLCFVIGESTTIPKDILNIKFSVLSVFVLRNDLREGVISAVNFFQDRGVHIRVISGDNPATVKAVSIMAGIKNSDLGVTGDEIEKWKKEEFDEKIKQFTIFARIKPEQKELIIKALKKDGFTAMVGDGANDALAIKNADLGIAMFKGAMATRQVASVVLTKNSFAELPNGVKLADNVIENIEMFTIIFLSQTFIGFILFIFVSIFGYVYPFTPLNITLINYSTVGIPSILILYWTMHPRQIINKIKDQEFFKKVLPFPLFSLVPQLICVVSVFLYLSIYFPEMKLNTSTALSLMSVGTIFFYFTQGIYGGGKKIKKQKYQYAGIAIIEIIILYFGFKIRVLTEFYNVISPSTVVVMSVSIMTVFYLVLQYFATKYFTYYRKVA